MVMLLIVVLNFYPVCFNKQAQDQVEKKLFYVVGKIYLYELFAHASEDQFLVEKGER